MDGNLDNRAYYCLKWIEYYPKNINNTLRLGLELELEFRIHAHE